MPLGHLPTELLQQIVDFLDVDDIEDVGLTSRRLRAVSYFRVAEHQRFRKGFAHLQLGPQYEDTRGPAFSAPRGGNEWDGHPINVLWAIRNNARIARYIQRIRFAAGDHLYFAREGGLRRQTRANLERSAWLGPLLHEDGDQACWAPSRQAAKSRHAGRRGVEASGSVDSASMVALLLTMTYNLRELSISPGSDNSFSKQAWRLFEHQAHQTSERQPGLLGRLQRVSLVDSARRSDALTTLMPFIRWTSVAALHCRGARVDAKAMEQHRSVYAAPAVEALELDEALMNDEALEALLRHCPGLRTLKFVAGSTTSAKNRNNDRLRPSSLMRLLEHHCASTLSKLSLDVSSSEASVHVTVDSFRGLTALRTLQLNVTHFFADGESEAPWLQETALESLRRLLQELPATLRLMWLGFGGTSHEGWNGRDLELVGSIERDLAGMLAAVEAARADRLIHLRRCLATCGAQEWNLLGRR